MDNRLLNINGSGQPLLVLALNLALQQSGYANSGFRSFKYEPEFGLVLDCTQTEIGFTPFLSALDAASVAPMVMDWLKSDQALTTPHGAWEGDLDHDGDNSLGWRVYVEDWGRVGPHYHPICAVKPVYLWHGK